MICRVVVTTSISCLLLQILFTDVWTDNYEGTKLEFSSKTTPNDSSQSFPSVDINGWQIDNVTHKHKISVVSSQVSARNLTSDV